MPRTTIRISATIDVPDDRPVVDYVRAVGNYIVDKLPMVTTGEDWRAWTAGDVTIETVIHIEDDEL